jgi:hypothetical protein
MTATTKTNNKTLLNRTTQTFLESLEKSGVDDHWMEKAVSAIFIHLSAELIAMPDRHTFSAVDVAILLTHEASALPNA